MDAISQSLLVPSGDSHAFKRGSIVFYHDNQLWDQVIRLGSGSYWTHVGVATGDTRTICAFATGGVCNWYGDGARGTSGAVEARPFPGDAEKLLTDMSAFLGRPYDFAGLVANPLWNVFGKLVCKKYLDGGPPATFHCSSLVAYAWREQKPDLLNGKPLRAITPQDIFNAVSPH